jgi:ABC-type bacteriocin/lantibiotic exporter with double-glycine peptidase domain
MSTSLTMPADAVAVDAGNRPIFADEAARIAAIERVLGTRRLAASPLARCLGPLLVALDWFGAPRALAATLDPREDNFSPGHLRELLAELGFRARETRWRAWQGGLDYLPVGSVVLASDTARVYIGRQGGRDWWHDGRTLVAGYEPAPSDTVVIIERDVEFRPVDAPQPEWLMRLLGEARREIGGVLGLSLVTNLLAIAVSLFTMVVYNQVIPSGAIGSLEGLTIGALIACVAGWGLRLARVGIMARLAGWAGVRIGAVAVRKTLGLPADLSSRMGVENNLVRLRSLEGVRQFFGGAGGVSLVEYPFVAVTLLVIALIGGWIVFVPLAGLAVMALLSWPLTRYLDASSRRVSVVSRSLQESTGIVARRLRALRGVKGSVFWRRRLVDLVVQNAEAGRRYALASALTQSVGQALAMSIVLATMGVGIVLVLDGAMSTGGLIATMMLIWRVTTPAQQAFTARVRISQIGDSARQLDRLLMSAGEHLDPQMVSPVTGLQPAVAADRVYYRFGADREPALAGISFAVEPGQMAVIAGPNGAGKSTLLECLAGTRAAQNGVVTVGGRDIRQFDPADYRAWSGYVPQEIQGLPLTVAEVVRLRCVTASDDEVLAALARAGGDAWWEFFGAADARSGLAARVDPWREDRDAHRARFVVKLATAIIDEPPLLLLDDPLADRDPRLEGPFQRLLDSLRGRSTIIMATHRADFIRRADCIAVLNNGALVHFGPVAQPDENATAEAGS